MRKKTFLVPGWEGPSDRMRSWGGAWWKIDIQSCDNGSWRGAGGELSVEPEALLTKKTHQKGCGVSQLR